MRDCCRRREWRWYPNIGSRFANSVHLIPRDAHRRWGGGLFNSDFELKEPIDLFSFSHFRSAARMENSRIGALRSVSVSKEGVRATVDEQIQRRNHAKVHEIEVSGAIGLPMSNIFATYVDDRQILEVFLLTSMNQLLWWFLRACFARRLGYVMSWSLPMRFIFV